MPFDTLATLNVAIILALLFLAAMSVRHLVSRYRFAAGEERGAVGLFGLFCLVSACDRLIAAVLTGRAAAALPLGFWAPLSLFVRGALGLVALVIVLWVLLVVWRRRTH